MEQARGSNLKGLHMKKNKNKNIWQSTNCAALFVNFSRLAQILSS